MKLSKRERILLILLIIILIIIFMTYFIIKPGLNRYSKTKEKLNELEHELKKNNMILKNRNKHLTELEEIKSRLQAIKTCFYEGDSNQVRLRVLAELEDDIGKAGLTVINKNLEVEQEKGSNIHRILFRANLKGDLESLVDFLQSVKNREKYFHIAQLEIRKAVSGRLHINILVEVINLEGDNYEL